MTISNNPRLKKGKFWPFAIAALMGLPAVAFTQAQSIGLTDLSAFRAPGSSWRIAGDVNADLSKENKLNPAAGTGVLVNIPDKKATDLFTQQEYGDFDLELDYMLAKGSNSGIYLHGRYELQLFDNWGDLSVGQSGNGAIYQRWNESAPEGQKGFEGHAPRTNASRAPGTWQHLQVSFQAPRFDALGQKTENARLLLVRLNGVTIHQNLQLSGPTRGSFDNKEAATGPLRIQGDHGAVALRNIRITTFATDAKRPTALGDPAAQKNDWSADPIYVKAEVQPILRSFVDVPGFGRLTHTVSVGSTKRVNYTYDAMRGSIPQFWRGDFLDATPMWHDRGDGSSRPAGAVVYPGRPVPAIARLEQPSAAWPKDTANMQFRAKGYSLDKNDVPTFRYTILEMNVEDRTLVADRSEGLNREITIDNPQPNTFFQIASAAKIEKLKDGLYLLNDKLFYVQLDKNSGAQVRDGADGTKELIVPVKNRIAYTILF